MRRMIAAAACAAALAGCTDERGPAVPTAPAAHPHAFTTGTSALTVGTYWKAPNQLWVYDRTPEVGAGTHYGDDAAMQKAVAAKMRLVRVALYWDTRFPDALDGVAAAAQRNGVQLEVVVHHRGQCAEAYADPYGTFASFVAGQAARHPEIHFWELYNEMDAPGWTNFFGGDPGADVGCVRGTATTRQQGSNYAQMLKRAYPAIKQANPGAYVLVGGLTGWAGWDFVRGIYDGGGKPYFDFMNIHVYGGTAQDDNIPDGVRTRGQNVADIMAANGDGGRPMWLTEFGAAAWGYNVAWGTPHTFSPPLDDGATYDSYQQQWWTDALNVVATSGLYTKALGYQLQATDGGPAAGCTDTHCWPASILPAGRVPEDYGFGLYYQDGTPRPVLTYLQSRDFNAGVRTNEWTQSVTVYSPAQDPIGRPFTRSGSYVTITGVPVNSLTPTAIDFGPSAAAPLVATVSGNDSPPPRTMQVYTASVSGGTGPYAYQWYKNGVLQAGKTSSTLGVSVTTLSFSVYVHVTDAAGGAVESETFYVQPSCSGCAQ